LPAGDWYALVELLGIERVYRRWQLNPLDWEEAVFWKSWILPSPAQRSLPPDALLRFLSVEKSLPEPLERLRERACAELREAVRRDLRVLASFGPASSWNPLLPIDGDLAGFTPAEIAAMVGRVRGRMQERIARRVARDAAGVVAIDDPVKLAQRQADGLDDERTYREAYQCCAPMRERIEFVYVLWLLRGSERHEGRTELWLQVGRVFENGTRRQCHQIWVVHPDGEWYCAGG
jgi:hypothetical protein